MSVSLTNVTRPGAEITDKDFRVLVSKMTKRNSGVLEGCELSIKNNTTVTVAPGYVVSSGSLIRVDGGDYTVSTTSSSTVRYLLIEYSPLNGSGSDATVSLRNAYTASDPDSAFSNKSTVTLLGYVTTNSSGLTKVTSAPLIGGFDGNDGRYFYQKFPASAVSLPAKSSVSVSDSANKLHTIKLTPGMWLLVITCWFDGVTNGTGSSGINLFTKDGVSAGSARIQHTTNTRLTVKFAETISVPYDLGRDGSAEYVIMGATDTARNVKAEAGYVSAIKLW